MGNTTYNGWTNYATWRVNLEIFDGIDTDYIIDMFGKDVDKDALEEYVDDVVFADLNTNSFSLLEGYANAFLSEVNYHEIQQHLINQINENDE
jgi:hypothetical protein